MVKIVLESEEVGGEGEESKETMLNALLAEYKLHTHAFPQELCVKNERIKKALFVLKKEDDFEPLRESVMKKDEGKERFDFSSERLVFIDLISSRKEIRPIFFIGNANKGQLTLLASRMRKLFD
ncbi:MAG: hypothetical protein ACFFAS_01865 [Promethearchaeota archaeon]